MDIRRFAVVTALTILALVPAHASTELPTLPLTTGASVEAEAAASALNALPKRQVEQGIKALIATEVITKVLKSTIREKRPESDSHDSFPSEQTSLAFAAATVVADYNPKVSVVAYAAATAVGVSRIESHAHHWQDVVAGAAIGIITARHFTKGGLSVSPSGIAMRWSW